jgi:hypothetical protein
MVPTTAQVEILAFTPANIAGARAIGCQDDLGRFSLLQK